MVVDLDKKQKRKRDRKPEIQKRNVARLRDEAYKQHFECMINEFMSVNNNDLWDLLEVASDEVCGYKKNRKCDVNTWWRNNGPKDEVQSKKVAYKAVTKITLRNTKMNTGDQRKLPRRQLLELRMNKLCER